MKDKIEIAIEEVMRTYRSTVKKSVDAEALQKQGVNKALDELLDLEEE